VPTLLVNGADDRVGDIATGNREWAARDPMVELRPGAGTSNQDNPAAFTAALTTFLDRALPVPARASMLGLLSGLRGD
jgi:pimeloyl-ACP methyl ester carboxylesterase